MSENEWKPPSITSPEGRRRLKESGVPLDEWSSMHGADVARDRAEYRRKLDRSRNIGIVILILLALGFVALEFFDGPTPSGDEPHVEMEETPFSPAAP